MVLAHDCLVFDVTIINFHWHAASFVIHMNLDARVEFSVLPFSFVAFHCLVTAQVATEDPGLAIDICLIIEHVLNLGILVYKLKKNWFVGVWLQHFYRHHQRFGVAGFRLENGCTLVGDS